MSTRRAFLCLILPVIAVWVVPAAAQVRAPQFADVHAVVPAGGQRGRTVSVSIQGKFLDQPSRVLASGDGIEVRSFRGTSSGEVRIELVLAADATPGVRALRVAGRYGVSDPGWFVVGTLPEAEEKEPNNSGGTATPVQAPCVVNGRLEAALDVDCFRFNARAGAPLVLAVASYTLDAQISSAGNRFLDTTLTVYDGSGRVIAGNEDYTTLDPALTLTVPKDGEYVAEVRDMGYQGGEKAVYRLTIGAVPYPTSVYPAGGRRGTRIPVQAAGLNVPSGMAADVNLPPDAPTGPRWILPSRDCAGAVPFIVGDLPEVLEKEPNDSSGGANPVEHPATVNGRLEKPGDEDRFTLALKKGEGVMVDVVGGRFLRSPVDLSAAILDRSGKQLAYNDDSPFTIEATANRSDSLSGDPRLEFTAPEDGQYLLALRDLAGRGGPDCIYRATIRRREPGFDLTTWYDNPSIKGPGGTAVIVVLLHRWGGYFGPVRVRVGGLPAGYEGSEAVIPAPTAAYNLTSTILTITAPADAQLGTVVPFWIEGEADTGGKTFVTRAQPRAHLGQNSDHSIFRRTDTCLACVVPVDEFRIRAGTRSVSGSPGETVRVPVTLEREPGFTGDISLLPLRGNLMTFGPPVSVPAGASQFEFPLSIPRDLPPGEHSFVLCRPIYGDLRSDRPHTSTPVLTLNVAASKSSGGAR
jgi:pre-peptidase/quinohemoprotein amine dehydrogenase alpha subunit-like protein